MESLQTFCAVAAYIIAEFWKYIMESSYLIVVKLAFPIRIIRNYKTWINFLQDLKSYLDSSKNGVIYISFGTNVMPSMLPQEKIQVLINVFSKLPYNILWKWDKEELPGKTDNIRIAKWFPQSDLLSKYLDELSNVCSYLR